MPYPPEPPVFGGALRIHYLLKHFVKHHDVTVVSFGRPDDFETIRSTLNLDLKGVRIVPFPWTGRYRRLGQLYAHWTKDSFIQLVCRSRKMQETLDDVFEVQDFDLVQMEFCMMGNFRLNTDAIRVLDAHNVEYDNYRRMVPFASSWIRKRHYYHEYKKLFREEIEACRRQDAIFVTSARDKEILDADVPEVPKYIVPNGVDLSYFTPSPSHREPASLVFTGMMGYVPNYDGILYFLDKVFPLIRKTIPEITVYIVGNRPPEVLQRRASDRIIITGFVSDVRPYVWRSSAYIVPLRMGGGTRLKVLEAMGMKKPIITTSIGCEGIDVTPGENVVVADEPRQFADAVIEVLRDVHMQRRLAENGYELVRAKYDWSIICSQVEEIYGSLVHPAKQREKVKTLYGQQQIAV